jgi:hypothetical protein
MGWWWHLGACTCEWLYRGSAILFGSGRGGILTGKVARVADNNLIRRSVSVMVMVMIGWVEGDIRCQWP